VSGGTDRRGFLSRVGRLGAALGLGGLGATGVVSRRASSASIGSRARTGPCPAPGAVTGADLVDVDRLWHWVEQMVDLGPRITGNRAHRRYLDFLHDRLDSSGLHVIRYPVPLDEWQARSWSLHVVDARRERHTIPVAFYRPHSGETAARGVTATVVDIGAGRDADYAGRDVQGRIVLADWSIPNLTAAVWTTVADYVHPPSIAEELSHEPFARIWLGIPEPPDLALAKQHGAVAMIDVLDQSTPLARGQFSPHQQDHVGLPALHLDRAQGERLRGLMARGPLEATLVLDARVRRTTVDYLGATLHGSGSLPGSLLLMTHTDGQNGTEENGGPALLALARYLTNLPRRCRPRDVTLLFSPNHMTSTASTLKPDTWLRQHPEILQPVAMALVAEHLGALAWDDDPVTGRYRASGYSELAAIPVGNSEVLKRVAIEEVQAADLRRAAVVRPREGGLYGEGTFAYRLGVPTIAFITGPSYLVQVTDDGDLDKLDRHLMHEQLVFLARVLSRMLNLPSARP
jgi:hypothetical protein